MRVGVGWLRSCAARSLSLVGVLAVLTTLSLAGASWARQGASAGGWEIKGVHVVGGPVAGGRGRVLLFAQGTGRAVWLEARNASDGALAWKSPVGFSQITQGVAAAPVAAGGVVLGLAPTAPGGMGKVRLEGIDEVSGRVLWRLPSPAFALDAPSICPKPLGATAFCAVVAASSGGPALLALAARTGKPILAVGNVERAMGLSAGLYEVIASKAALAEIATPGGVVWAKPFSAFFGAGFDPNYGWVFDRLGSLQVGSVGYRSSGKSQNLAATEVVGIDAATGKLRWRERGEFECGGVVPLRVPFLCLLTGTATSSGGTHIKTSPGATLTFAGFNAASGHITWRQPAGGISDVVAGKVVIADDHSLLASARNGRREILDLRTGQTSTPKPGEAFWCQELNVFHVAPSMAGLRVGSSLFRRCDANGQSITKPVGLAGSSASSALGVRVGQLFIWAATDGLRAVRIA
jgi:outer membrane protein assembly factor BamB